MFDKKKWSSLEERKYKQVIFHADVNSAFLSWEAVYRLKHLDGTLDLRTIPSAVGGDIEKRHGIILAKSIPAKPYGVKTGEPVTDAVKKCPNLVLVPPNYSLYETSSQAMMEILKEYTPCVEQYSIDEAFMDMSGMEALYGQPVLAATQIKDRIYQELGFTVNIGISTNKLLAKMASDFKKPNLVHTLYPDEIREKMWRLPAGDLFFVGRATEKKLKSKGIHTIGDIARTDPEILKSFLHKHGEVIWNFANGIDTASVETVPPPNKGYGNSTTISFDVSEPHIAKKVLLSLAESIGRRLRQDHVQIRLVSVGIRYYDLTYESHQKILDVQTDITNEIYKAACQCFDEMWDGTPIRHLGIHTSKVKDQEYFRQLSLFDEGVDYEKLKRLDRAVDAIRKRFGNDSVMRAAFLQDEWIDHISGGISREKRTVDYSKVKVE